MTDIYHKNVIEYTTSIVPKEINKNINITLTRKLRDDLEGKCIKEGYVKRESIKILSRSLGEVLLSHCNGTILYHIKFQADICNPMEGMIIKSRIININKMGALAEIIGEEISPVAILIAKQHHIDNTNFENLKKGDDVDVKVLGKRFEYGDNQISIIGLLNDSMSSEETLYQPSEKSSVSSISDVESQDEEPDTSDSKATFEPDDESEETDDESTPSITKVNLPAKKESPGANILSKLSGSIKTPMPEGLEELTAALGDDDSVDPLKAASEITPTDASPSLEDATDAEPIVDPDSEDASSDELVGDAALDEVDLNQL